MTPRPCTEPGCPNLLEGGRCAVHRTVNVVIVSETASYDNNPPSTWPGGVPLILRERGAPELLRRVADR